MCLPELQARDEEHNHQCDPLHLLFFAMSTASFFYLCKSMESLRFCQLGLLLCLEVSGWGQMATQAFRGVYRGVCGEGHVHIICACR